MNHSKQQGSIRGFTLIELLAVVAIIGLVFGIAVAALPGMTRGSAMRGSTAELRSTLSLARQWAITKREITHVVFADGSPDYDSSYEYRLAGERAFRGYAVVGEKSGMVSDWKFLKTGIYFLPDDGDPNISVPNYSPFKNPFETKGTTGKAIPFPEPPSTTELLPAIGFKPTGSLHKMGGSPLEIYIAEGYVTSAVGSGDVSRGDLRFKPNSGVTGFQISGLTGALRVRVFGEEVTP